MYDLFLSIKSFSKSENNHAVHTEYVSWYMG